MENTRPFTASIRSIIYLSLFAFLVFFTGEMYLRVTASHIVKKKASKLDDWIESDPELLVTETKSGRRLVPKADVVIRHHYLSNRDIDMKINSLGFRDEEISLQRNENEKRVLVLGDSITWGDYLQAEEVFVKRAEYYLNQKNSRDTFHFINAGVGDVGLNEEIAILKDQGLKVKPDIVVVAFYLNDSRPPWGFSDEKGGSSWIRTHSLLINKIYSAFKLKQWIQKKGHDRFAWIHAYKRLDWMHSHEDFMKLVFLAQYDWGAAWQKSSWEEVDKHLLRLKDLAQQHGFKVAIVLFPSAFQVYADFLENTPQRVMAKKANELGFPYLDLLPILGERADKKLYYDHCHPNVEANDIIGKSLAEFIDKTYSL